jgi:hypothetical protein
VHVGPRTGFPHDRSGAADMIRVVVSENQVLELSGERPSPRIARKTAVTEHLGLRLQRERFQRFSLGFNATVCTFNVRNLLALGI